MEPEPERADTSATPPMARRLVHSAPQRDSGVRARCVPDKEREFRRPEPTAPEIRLGPVVSCPPRRQVLSGAAGSRCARPPRACVRGFRRWGRGGGAGRGAPRPGRQYVHAVVGVVGAHTLLKDDGQQAGGEGN